MSFTTLIGFHRSTLHGMPQKDCSEQTVLRLALAVYMHLIRELDMEDRHFCHLVYVLFYDLQSYPECFSVLPGMKIDNFLCFTCFQSHTFIAQLITVYVR